VITGGAGFIGASLANILDNEYEVVCVDNLSTGSWSRCTGNYQKITADLSTMPSHKINELLHGAEYLFHLAAVKLHNAANDYTSIISNNISVSQKLFDSAGRSGLKKVLFTSSLYAYGSMGPDVMRETDSVNPQTLYGASKYFTELNLNLASEIGGFEFVIPRLFFIYGPRQYALGGYKSVIIKNFERIASGKPMEIFGTGEQSLDYVYIDDCVRALRSLMFSNASGIFNISSSIPRSINELANMMLEISEGKGLKFLDADGTKGSIRYGDNQKLLELDPNFLSVPLRSGLERIWEWMKAGNR
jgi:UDP-glucose 4-epimerase